MKKVITILSDAPFIPTGYSNQAKQLVKSFCETGHQVHWLANAYTGVTLDNVKFEDGTEFNCKIYGSIFGQDYFANTMSQHLKDTKTDVFIILLDTFMLHGHPENPYAGWFLNVDTSPAKTYFYFPTDGGGGLPKGCELILKKVDCPVAMSRFGQKQIGDYYQIKTEFIPHMVDSKRFYRLPEKQRSELRAKWGFKDKFVIGVVARNQPRKNLDRTIKVMAKLRDKIPNAILLLHMDPNDPAGQMFNIGSLISKFNLDNRVVFTGMKCHKGFDWSQMNDVYNLMDCFLLTTSGEGFGIPIIEAMACEVPVIATSYTTTPELVEETKSGYGINLSGVETLDLFALKSQEYDYKAMAGTMTGTWEVERGFCDIDDAVSKINTLYKDPNMQKIMGLNGRKAVLEVYDYPIVTKMWEDLLNK